MAVSTKWILALFTVGELPGTESSFSGWCLLSGVCLFVYGRSGCLSCVLFLLVEADNVWILLLVGVGLCFMFAFCCLSAFARFLCCVCSFMGFVEAIFAC